jgi:hypothetical protein
MTQFGRETILSYRRKASSRQLDKTVTVLISRLARWLAGLFDGIATLKRVVEIEINLRSI